MWPQLRKQRPQASCWRSELFWVLPKKLPLPRQLATGMFAKEGAESFNLHTQKLLLGLKLNTQTHK